MSARKKVMIIISIVFFLVVVIIVAYVKSIENPFGNYIKIQNYGKYISDLPREKKHFLNSSLYGLVKMNTVGDKKIKVDDAFIREGSVNVGYDKDIDIHHGSFIVDMESIKQSYGLDFEWSSKANNSDFMNTGPPSNCLPIEDLKYGDFGCRDAVTEMEKDIDPIIEHLPYSTFHHYVTANVGDDGKTGLDVIIYLISSETIEENRQPAIDRYKAEIIEWIKSINLNPDDYIINYQIN